MISFNYETDFKLPNEDVLSKWISSIITLHNCKEDEISYVFCDDEYLHKLNVQFLNHDTLTDIISFDYSVGKNLQGDIFISVERVEDNAKDLGLTFKEELHRVIIHGILHYCGFKDKTESDAKQMRLKEDEALSLLQTML
ncbi:Metal-dependent hydrolase YbeY, involved in rRNA and/or ribosome maturation and assembly [Mesoflavibacter sp. HG96]|uniref:rRNA maturation RNase YbeY n=1 Tax=Mesoflavibacter TaxID=444051 RepID=UPI000D0FD1F3|nr:MULTISPECIES: rRNA maturation RNase YbeY [Mesoflavibacter]QIJ88904.1 Metal-dependent hydrolase YbeY, involved in rRNA and/or ribosome maturation and assembly [Mesoflavibacter sp. HG96]QIJ91632.1 Metal-dependent hydrolase YbeY, involved in rRNA and/or ribosome maturation and assembly [Mesoflavibacter sp. HG37]